MNAKIWLPVVLVIVVSAVLSCGLLSGGTSDVAPSDLVLAGAEEVVVADYRRASEAEGLPSSLLVAGDETDDVGEQLQDGWEGAVGSLDTDFREVSSVFYVRLPRAGYMIAEGGFDFESIRDELEDLDFEEDDYRGFQMWSDDFGSGAALLEGSGVYVHGDKDAVEDVLKALDRGEGFIAPESGLRRALAASGTGLFAVASADCDATDVGAGTFLFLTGVDFGRYDLEGCDAVAVSFAEPDRDESELVFGAAFRSDRRAESGAVDLQDALEDADDFDADVEDASVDGDTATVRLTLDDERSAGTQPFGLLSLPASRSGAETDRVVVVQTVVVREEVAIEVPVVQTVVVEKEVEVEVPVVVERVVEKEVEVPGRVVLQTVIVEKEVIVEREVEVVKEVPVVQTVVVERQVVVEKEVPVVQTVVVERQVVVEKEVPVTVEKVVEAGEQATPTTARTTSEDYIVVAAGFEHTCALRVDGTVVCWGLNDRGQSTPPDGSFASIAAGGWHNCGLRKHGSIECWGSDYLGLASPPTGDFISVSTGSHINCGIREDRTAECWGFGGRRRNYAARRGICLLVIRRPTYLRSEGGRFHSMLGFKSKK